MTLRQETRFPESDETVMRLSLSRADKFALKLRHPGWLARPMEVRVNDQVVHPDGDAKHWDRIDLVANHNAFAAGDAIGRAGDNPVAITSSYTEVVALSKDTLLVIYDRLPMGWSQVPPDSKETDSVWVVRVTIKH